MIPKIIHYCWFGGKPMPKLEKRCMESWQRMLPEYKIMRWDETTFDVYSHPFTAAAYKAKNMHLLLTMCVFMLFNNMEAYILIQI